MIAKIKINSYMLMKNEDAIIIWYLKNKNKKRINDMNIII